MGPIVTSVEQHRDQKQDQHASENEQASPLSEMRRRRKVKQAVEWVTILNNDHLVVPSLNANEMYLPVCPPRLTGQHRTLPFSTLF